jgi:hypothetical protein
MGILTDYFAATAEEATACADHGPLDTQLPTAELKWVEPAIILGRLWAAIDGADYDVDSYSGEDHLVAGDHEGPWLIRIKDACRDALAGIRDDQVTALAETWSTAEEWSGADASSLATIIPDLRDVARAACAPDRNLYVWVCL